MNLKSITLILFVLIFKTAISQNTTNKWSLQAMIEYAIKNNLTIKQAEITAKLAFVQKKQVDMLGLPSLNANTGIGTRLGYSINPTTNSFDDNKILYNNFGLNIGVPIYNGSQIKNTKEFESFNAQAALEDVKKAVNDVAVAIAAYYLQALSNYENINVAEVQIKQTLSQLDITKKRVDAGSLPELNIAELEAQLATDSSNYIVAKSNYRQAIIGLQAFLNLDFKTPFEIETPPIDNIPVEPIVNLTPDYVYNIALENQPLQKGNKIRIKAAEKNKLIAKSYLFPSITGGINLSTNFSNSYSRNKYTFYNSLGEPTTVSYINNWSEIWSNWGKQISNNFGQNIGVNISIPIFNNGQAKANIEKANINYNLVVLKEEQNNQTLKIDINNAYINAINSLEKQASSEKAVFSTNKAYQFALKRYEAGLLSTFELITLQNNYLRAKLQYLNARYDYIFKIKLLELYKGQGIKLNY